MTFGGDYKFMVAVGGSPKQFKVENGVMRCRCVPDGRLKSEDFRGDPRSGSNARGFICFGEEGGVMIE